jgi:hypothetical protein
VRPGRSHAGAKGALDARAQALARAHIRMRTHSQVRIGRGRIKRQWWQDRDSRQFAHFLMNTGEFAEVVEGSLGINMQASNSLFFLTSLE